MSDKIFFCTLCDQEWPDSLPEGAVKLKSGHGGGPAVYRFKDGSVHVIKEANGEERAKE